MNPESSSGEIRAPLYEGFLVFDVVYQFSPVIFGGHTSSASKQVLLPILAISSGNGDVVVPDEALSWARHQMAEGVASTQIRRRLNSVGRLYEFAQRVAPDMIAAPGAMDLIVWEYLRTRVATPLDIAARLFEHWKPVQYEVVRTEFRDLVDFGRFCALYTGQSSPIGSAFKAGREIWINTERKLPVDDLLSHLQAQRARWHALVGGDNPLPPSGLRKLAVSLGRKKSNTDTCLAIEQIDCIVDRERNPIFKALWIQLAYLGTRISELLNEWRCDVLDPSYARQLFNADVAGPLVIFADPRHSRYAGSFDPERSLATREEILKARYGLVPRPDLEGKKQRAGWKGMSTFNPSLRITHGTWICLKRAEEFGALISDIMEMHESLQTDAVHPYLFVNIRNAEHLGAPTQIGNVEKAFLRACQRAGVPPGAPGAHLHGLRHYYKWYAETELGLPEHIIQEMLRQRSPLSQRVYGKRSSDRNKAMSALHQAKGKSAQ